jgi:hypothetical protein
MILGSPYVFVGGLHRSGTTPLTRTLAAHPDISGLTGTGVHEDEGQHLQDVYPRIRQFGGMGRFALAPGAHLRADSPLASPANADRLLSAWAPYWDENKQLRVEKSPANLIMGQFLQAMFPGSALIVVIRHPIAVALAMQKWNPRVVARNGRRHVTLAGLVRHWLRAHELLRSDAASLERLHVVRYEDIVDDPDRAMATVSAFLGLASPLDASAFRKGRSDTYQRQWEAMRHRPVARYLRRSIESAFADDVAVYGYDISRVGEVVGPLDAAGLFRR